jgi:flavorubredoxin
VPKLLVVYDSQTGNTEKMAEAVVEGAKSISGVEVVLKYYVRPQELEEASAIIFGSPTYHHDMTLPIKNILEEAARANVQLRGKIGAVFGSYGWSAEAPQLISEVLKNKFGMRTIDAVTTILYTPDNNGLEQCRNLGKTVAEKIAKV